jgi:hypothetical protein
MPGPYTVLAMRRVCLPLLALASLFVPAAGGPPASESREQGPILMTYWEAKAAGYRVPPLPSETGMRVCTASDFHGGFSSAEEAEQSLAEYEAKWGEAGSPGDCQVDPTKAWIVVNARISPLMTSVRR